MVLKIRILQTQVGIHDGDLYTTAFDLSLLAKYAMNNEKFREIVKTFSYTLPATSIHPAEDRVFTNSNLLLDNSNQNYYYEYTTGIKTGFTDQAGDCLVASAKKDDIEFIVVCLHSNTNENGLRKKFLDCKTLFDFAFENYTTYYKDLQAKKQNNIFDNIASLFKNNDNSKGNDNLEENTVPSENIFGDKSSFVNFALEAIIVIMIILALYFFLFTRRGMYKRRKRKPRK